MKTATTRIFRPERPLRGDTGITPQQPVDDASWIWMPGADQWGGAVFSETRSTPETLARAPQTFLRFRRDFEAAPEGFRAFEATFGFGPDSFRRT